MIRDPEPKDIDRLTELTTEVYGDFMAKSGMPLIKENLKRTVEAFVKMKQGVVLERDGKIVGIAAWHITPHPANFSCKVFQEILWCLKSSNIMDASILLKAFIRKAEEAKANIIVLVNLSVENEPQLRRIYKKLGFEYLESHYSKAIGGH